MKNIKKLATPATFVSYAAVGGYEEGRGLIGKHLDLVDEDDRFGQDTWEMAEAEMGRRALNIALGKGKMSHTEPELLIAGDLQNQCVASSVGLDSFGIPFLGVYGACSTCTESLLLGSAMIDCGAVDCLCAVTSSHNSAAERQFRTPVEYGGQRAPSAQWTATAAGAFILSKEKRDKTKGSAEICDFRVGRIIDGGTSDASNMGAAMAFAAADTIINYFEVSDMPVSDFDFIVTGDLGKVGSEILAHILKDKLPAAVPRHLDCGLLMYDEDIQDMHSGASGCGTSAAVLATYFLPKVERGEIKNMLLLSTGALMSPSSVLQGNNIKGIAPVIHIRHSGASE